MIDDVKEGVWSELKTKKPTDEMRRNLQKAYTEALINIVNPTTTAPATNGNSASNFNVKNTDVISVARGKLTALKKDIDTALPATSDKMTKYHLEDISYRIKKQSG